MERRFESELKDLKNMILSMGGHVEQTIEKVIEAFDTRNKSILEDVWPIEKKINTLHIDIDNTCLEVLARLSPVAADLRLILAIIKINSDLERIGDQAVNISYNADHFLTEKNLDIELELPKMASLVQAMVRDSLDAFTRGDVNLAQEVLIRDDEVDAIKNNTFKLLVGHMQKHSSQIESSLDLILIARNLERMGDHATNIAEDVIFACTGEDVRHGGGQGAT
jgi:phosphate transport system protein